MKKILVVLFLLCISGFILYSINYVDNGEIDYSLESKKYNEKVRELKIQKEMLEETLDMYDKADINLPNMGSTIFLLTDTNKKHLDDSIPILDDNDYIGVIALSSIHIPENNNPNYLNKNEIDSLTEKGYELVIKLGIGDDVKEVFSLFKNNGYDIKGFYLPYEIINVQTINDIKEIGNMVIIGNFGEYEDDEILLIEKSGNHYSNVKNKFFDSIKESKTIAISIGYDDNDKNEEYDYVNFSSMISVINPYVDDDTTDVCNISQAIERHNKLLEKLESVDGETRAKIKELKDQIETINKQLAQ